MSKGHGRNPGYIPGDHWGVCDLCGFDYRFSHLRETWDGYWVCPRDYYVKHPQLKIRGLKDRQAVPVSRPPTETIHTATTLSSAASKGDLTVDITATGIEDNYAIGITLDDGNVQWTFATADQSGNTVTINEALDDDAASGNVAYYSSIPTRTTSGDL